MGVYFAPGGVLCSGSGAKERLVISQVTLRKGKRLSVIVILYST
jgi:hypothetical protein